MMYKEIAPGVKMPMLGFGVYQIDKKGVCKKAVLDALQTGYRLIDTASFYQNESEVGAALAESGVSREELFITTKAWPTELGEDKTKRAFDTSLTRLGLDYIDLYLIHQPFGDIYGAWRTMEQLLQDGLVRAIGVSNFAPDRLMDLILFNEISPAVNQIEINVFYQQWEAQAFMEAHGVAVEGWAPFARGRNSVFEEPTLQKIAEAHNKTIPQVILRWQLERGIICIPKSTHTERIRENFDVFDFDLTPAEKTAIKLLDTGKTLFFDQRDAAQVEARMKH